MHGDGVRNGNVRVVGVELNGREVEVKLIAARYTHIELTAGGNAKWKRTKQTSDEKWSLRDPSGTVEW